MNAPRILIVGGVAGGASAATRARRINERAGIIMFEKGEHVSFANCGLPYHVGGQIRERGALLVSNAREFHAKFNIEVRTRHEVTRIDRPGHRIEVLNRQAGERTWEHYDKLILAPGAAPIVPPWNGVDAVNAFTLRDLSDMDRIKAFIDAGSSCRAVVIGAGFIGLEMVEALVSRGLEVTVIELAPQVLPPLDPEIAREIEGVLKARGVTVLTGAGVENLVVEAEAPAGGEAGSSSAPSRGGFIGQKYPDAAPSAADSERRGRITAVRLSDGTTIPADLVLISIGVRPNVRLAAEAGLTIGKSGAIAVNRHLQTSDPDIYAVGDAAEVMHRVSGQLTRIPLAGSANRNGRLAGEHAASGQALPATPVTGTAIVGVFGAVAAMTGLSEKAARQAGLQPEVAYAIRSHHAGYYPGAETMILKLVYDAQSRRVLGAQGVGGAGVDKRIDTVATVLHFGGTLDDLAGLDLAYAPQFGSAKDPLHIAAFVAMNQAEGKIRSISPGSSLPPEAQLVDVRMPEEYTAGTLPGARNLPLPELRSRLSELDPRWPVVIFCQVGQRGYIAARILMQSGFAEVYNLAGGYRLHRGNWSARG